MIYYQFCDNIQNIIKHLCNYKAIESIKRHMMPCHIHLLVKISPKSIIIYAISKVQ
ncbi:MAG TPA: transposase [Candidatus Coprocola pullicola]|nr:transposase [Candidatus Coprocola pullicola]